MVEYEYLPLSTFIKPAGPHARQTIYRWNQDHPGLLVRLEGLRETLVHLPTYRAIFASAKPTVRATSKETA